MRTTLTIDDDLAGILRRKSRELGKSFKELVNMALRKGLAEDSTEKNHEVIVRPHDFGRNPGIDLNRLNQLVDELEVEDYLRKAAKDDSAGH
ncbi:MAG: hypothetical protein EXS37_07535 [Opitutus sp.]|nr:hypothetical protein [Opitutus sp.]